MRPPSLYRIALSGTPIWSIIKVQWTFKKDPIKKFGTLSWKSFKEIPTFCSQSVEPLISVNRLFVNWRKQNAKIPHRSWENLAKKIFFDPIFLSYKNRPHAKFWYDHRAVAYCRWWKFEWNHNSQFREVKDWNSRSPLWTKKMTTKHLPRST